MINNKVASKKNIMDGRSNLFSSSTEQVMKLKIIATAVIQNERQQRARVKGISICKPVEIAKIFSVVVPRQTSAEIRVKDILKIFRKVFITTYLLNCFLFDRFIIHEIFFVVNIIIFRVIFKTNFVAFQLQNIVFLFYVFVKFLFVTHFYCYFFSSLL